MKIHRSHSASSFRMTHYSGILPQSPAKVENDFDFLVECSDSVLLEALIRFASCTIATFEPSLEL